MISNALVVRHEIPTEIAAISAEAAEAAHCLAERATGLRVDTLDRLAEANDVHREIDALAKTIASQRLDVTRPIDALKKAIIAAEEAVTGPLVIAKKTLACRIVSYQAELQRQREEAERKAREEAERLEAERQREIAAKRAAAEEAKQLGLELAPEDIDEPPRAVVVPIVIPPPLPEMPKSTVRVTVRQKLEIWDESLIPLAHAGVILRVPDVKAIEKLLRAGVTIPGCRLVSVESIGAAGGRA